MSDIPVFYEKGKIYSAGLILRNVFLSSYLFFSKSRISVNSSSEVGEAGVDVSSATSLFLKPLLTIFTAKKIEKEIIRKLITF